MFNHKEYLLTYIDEELHVPAHEWFDTETELMDFIKRNSKSIMPVNALHVNIVEDIDWFNKMK